MGRACSQNGKKGRSALNVLTGKPTGKRPLGRPRRRWEDNIRMDLKGIDINKRNWVNSAQDRDYCDCGIETPGSISHGVMYNIYLKRLPP